MILTGWKQISKHLGYGIRTVQRWERKGLPVKRVTGGPRSPVVANSEDLDGWMLRGKTLPRVHLQIYCRIFNVRESCSAKWNTLETSFALEWKR